MPDHPPVPPLGFGAQPDGGPPAALRHGVADSLVQPPAGGEPLLVLHRRADVLELTNGHPAVRMAGVTATGELRCHPLTGAEMQSPDGGWLNMDGDGHHDYRFLTHHLFTRRAAEATRPQFAALARELAAALQCTGQRAADVLGAYAGPLAAASICDALGAPRADWATVNGFAQVAFALVPTRNAVAAVADAWEALYDYYGWLLMREPRCLSVGITAALAGSHTPAQIVHSVGVVGNGFGAVLPVLAVCLAELAQRPSIVADCLAGRRTWAGVTDHLIATRALFPVALPRVLTSTVHLASGTLPAGTHVLPSLAAAALDGPPDVNIAFGPGPHMCPGANLARLWATVALAVFFTAFPAAQLAGPLHWQPGTLAVPHELVLSLY